MDVDGDGILDAVSDEFSTDLRDYDGNADIKIGIVNHESAPEYFHGSISEIGMWNSALTHEKIQELMFTDSIGYQPDLIAHWKFNANDGDILYSRLIDEKYPNYSAVIPQENPYVLKLQKEDFLNSIKATSIATNKNTNQISLNLALGEVFLKSINQPESKTVHAPLKTAEYDGEKISIGFNATYLKEAITNYPTEDILFVFKDELSATLLLPETKNHKTTILLMPVRINE